MLHILHANFHLQSRLGTDEHMFRSQYDSIFINRELRGILEKAMEKAEGDFFPLFDHFLNCKHIISQNLTFTDRDRMKPWSMFVCRY